MSVKKIVTIAIFIALSVILVYMLRLPIFPSAAYLEYDLADVPIIFCTLIFGPTVGLIMTFIVSILQGITVSAQGGIIGICMHIVATGSLVFTVGMLKRKFNSPKGIAFSLTIGVLIWIIVMVIWNILLTPLYTGMPREAIYGMLLPIIVPFNLIKAGLNSLFAYLLFIILKKRLSKYFDLKYYE